MTKKKTKDYYHIIWQTETMVITRSTFDKKYVAGLLENLQEKYGSCPGRLALQTWQMDDEIGPSKMLSESILETYAGWEKPEPVLVKPTILPTRNPIARRAEWPRAKGKIA